MLQRFRSTKFKLSIASSIYKILRLFLQKDHHKIERNGIVYEIDLREGIDLSLFLFGNFQNHIVSIAKHRLKPNSTVIDVGANCGSISLQICKGLPKGKVFAFEPTDYAFKKALKNINLNPSFGSQIEITQAFVSDEEKEPGSVAAYSSWNISGQRDGTTHPIHGGSLNFAQNIPTVSIDGFIESRDIPSVDLIKVDTDGHELKVLRGAAKTIQKFRPIVIFEVGLYLLEEKGQQFTDFLNFFKQVNYKLESPKGNTISEDTIEEEAPRNGTIDLIAIPLDQI